MCFKANVTKRFFVLLLNSQKSLPVSLEVFKERPNLNVILEWATRTQADMKDLHVVRIDIPYSRLI